LGVARKLFYLKFSLLRGEYPDYPSVFLVAGADPGFVGFKAFSILGALFKKKNTKLE